MPKPKKKSARNNPAKVQPKQALTLSGAYEPSKLLVVLGRVQARIAANTPVERAAFASLMTDAQRAELGRRTKAPGVAGEAVSWVVQVDEDGREYPELFEFYAKTRFSYLLESTRALVAGVVADSGRGKDHGTVKAGATSASESAKAFRKRLLRRLGEYAGERTEALDAIQAAKGSIAEDDLLATSIKDLVALAQTWAANADPHSKVLATSAKLTPAFCEEALTAAKALTGAAADAKEAGRGSSKDSPAVNVREGTVLHEMDVAMAAVEEAHEEHPTIRRLTPGPATRGVLGPKKAPPATPAPAPVDPPADPQGKKPANG